MCGPEADLAQYNQAYLNEGISGTALQIPAGGKSTELLLMNQTRLDEFLEANPQYSEENMESTGKGWNGWLRDILKVDGQHDSGKDRDGSPFVGVDNPGQLFCGYESCYGFGHLPLR